MTVVIGIVTPNYVLLASDGFAVEQEDENSPITKQDLYSKVRLLQDGRYVIGSAGSHALGFEVDRQVERGAEGTEEQLLESLGQQLRALNDNQEGKRSVFLLGYMQDRTPRLYLFDVEGRYTRQDQVAALGSGADNALEYLSAVWDPGWSLSQAVEAAVEAVYQAARTPTVNFCPMIAYLGPSGSRDLSPVTISMFDKFRAELKAKLAGEARKKGG